MKPWDKANVKKLPLISSAAKKNLPFQRLAIRKVVEKKLKLQTDTSDLFICIELHDKYVLLHYIHCNIIKYFTVCIMSM